MVKSSFTRLSLLIITCIGAIALTLMFLIKDARTVERKPADRTFNHLGSEIQISFLGEISSESLFKDKKFTDLIMPVDDEGANEGRIYESEPDWLHFKYRIDEYSRTVLIAAKPVMNNVSWNAVARAGAALGDGSMVRIHNRDYPQNAVIEDSEGKRYRIRLMRCGQSTTAPFSEWNLLIGGVHEGDVDFRGERYGWIEKPYSDEELKVGYDGSLNWCSDLWREGRGERVVRGYFNVSRFHAANPGFRGNRIYWRPLLELIEDGQNSGHPVFDNIPQISPNRAVEYYGIISYRDLFGDMPGIADMVNIREGNYVAENPDWLGFTFRGKNLLVASKPVGHSISWNTLASAGLTGGDDSVIRAGAANYRQDVKVEDARGNLYRVRLLDCGKSTLDHSSEWNSLLGGIHRGDGDFIAGYDGIYAWIDKPLSNEDLYIGTMRGTASWCREYETRNRRRYSVNRGYLTIARYHTTRSGFSGYGFSWRPVLELVEQ